MKNKYFPILIVILGLALVTMSCKTLSNLVSKPDKPTIQEQAPDATFEPQTEATEPAQEVETTQPEEATVQPEPTSPPSEGDQPQSSDFPMPAGAKSVINVGGTTNFQVQMKLKDIMSFYRDAFSKQGLKENKQLTVTSDSTFNMVFNGASDGLSVVIQGIDLGNGASNVSISRVKM